MALVGLGTLLWIASLRCLFSRWRAAKYARSTKSVSSTSFSSYHKIPKEEKLNVTCRMDEPVESFSTSLPAIRTVLEGVFNSKGTGRRVFNRCRGSTGAINCICKRASRILIHVASNHRGGTAFKERSDGALSQRPCRELWKRIRSQGPTEFEPSHAEVSCVLIRMSQYGSFPTPLTSASLTLQRSDLEPVGAVKEVAASCPAEAKSDTEVPFMNHTEEDNGGEPTLQCRHCSKA